MKSIIKALLIILLTSCAQYDQDLNISNVTESQTLILKNKNEGNVHSINIRGTGYINGNAQIILILNEKPYKTENISGNVNFKWDGDWYSNNATIIYTATNVTEGNLSIEYNFETWQ